MSTTTTADQRSTVHGTGRLRRWRLRELPLLPLLILVPFFAGRAVRRLHRALRSDGAGAGREDLHAALLDGGRQHGDAPRHRFPGPRFAQPADLSAPASR